MNGNSSADVALDSSFPRKIRRPIVAVIVHQNREEVAGIVLLRQRGDGASDRFGFIACRNDGHDTRPAFQGLELNGLFMDLPEISSGKEKIKPRSQRKDGDKIRIQRHALLCNKSAGRATRGLPCEWAGAGCACQSRQRLRCRPPASRLAIQARRCRWDLPCSSPRGLR